ncbi:MAG: HAD-IIIA family hydrolase [Desulfobacterales bacterium]|nr:HAD-IIIA family hydrolase [Desulfobacterales bacterium]
MISSKLENIRALLLDVDGVLTDGSIIYNDNGLETKVFNVKDGLGLRLLLKAGIKVGIVTGRRSKAIHHRCKNLGISHLFEGTSNKAAILDFIIDQIGVAANQIAFIGDDLPDISIMRKVGCSIAVNDAHEKIIENADMVTTHKGGAGAVREVCETILKAQGIWEKTLEYFL